MSHMTKGDLYDYVREHLDIDETELTTTLLDAWAREATNKIVRSRERWPWLETTWSLSVTSGVRDYPLSAFDPEVDKVTDILGYQRRLRWIGRDDAESRYLPYQNIVGRATFYNVWGGNIRIYPWPTTETLEVRGYRKVNDWVGDGLGAYPDMPDEFADLIRIFLVANAYMHQEDPQMSETFMRQFVDELGLMKKRIGTDPMNMQLQLNGGVRVYYPGRDPNRLTFPFE